jgi:GntR family transcriptional regulator, histidine utilization repressor
VNSDQANDERDKLSLYDRIRQDIEDKIMSGLWAPGYRIPFEHELMKQYDCSRMTINRALATLVERGLIERRKRLGSFVMAPMFHQAVFQLPELRTNTIAQGKTYEFDLIDREVRQANASDRSHLNMAGGQVLHLTCLHYVDARPYAFEDRIINLELVPGAMTAAFDRDPPNSWLFAHVPWSDARHRITALNADSGLARRLGIREEAACLVVERWTWRLPERTTYVRMIHPAHLYAIDAIFRP